MSYIPYASSQLGVFTENLPNFRHALAQTRNSVRDTKILCIGDSTTQGVGDTSGSFNYGAWPARLNQLLNRNYIPAAAGLVHAGSIYSGNLNLQFAQGTGWALQANVGWASGTATEATPTSTGNLVFTAGNGQVCDTFDVYYLGNASQGTVTMTGSGGTPTVVNTFNTVENIYKATIACGSASSSNSLTITPPTGGNCYITGIEPYLSTSRVVRVANVGAGSSTSGEWVVDTRGFQTRSNLTAYQPDLTIISLGLNDATLLTPTATLQANLQTLIGWAQAANSDVMLASTTPSTSNAGRIALCAPYSAMYNQLAASLNIPLLDIFNRWGGTYNPQMMNSDMTHPNDYGYWDWGTGTARLLQSV